MFVSGVLPFIWRGWENYWSIAYWGEENTVKLLVDKVTHTSSIMSHTSCGFHWSTCVKHLWNMCGKVCVRCFKYDLSDMKDGKYEIYFVTMCLWKRKEKFDFRKLQIFYTQTHTHICVARFV